MASRRKRALPPWLQGVEVKKKRPVSETSHPGPGADSALSATGAVKRPDSSTTISNHDAVRNPDAVTNPDVTNQDAASRKVQEADVSSHAKVTVTVQPQADADVTTEDTLGEKADVKTMQSNTCCETTIETPSDSGSSLSTLPQAKPIHSSTRSDQQRTGNQHQTTSEEAKVDLVALVGMSYDEYLYNGPIIYSHTSADCNILCEDMIANIDTSVDTFLGFDMEWPVVYEKGRQAKTALVQVFTDKPQDKCYLFHISCMSKFPVMLRKLIEMPSVKKVGMNIDNDIWKLGLDFDINARAVVKESTVELKDLANKKLKSSENWSLEGLAKNVLRVRISKDPSIRKCDWRQFPLPEAQQRYAATDAAVAILIYNKLCKISR